jgi:hypothetical protein
MASYLIFSITYFHVFKGLTIRKRVDCKIDPVTMWYQALWRQKATYYFYEVYNEFVIVFKKLLFGENTTRLSLEATTFLNKRGTLEKMENYNVIRIFGSRESPFFLPYYISDKIFIIEVARKYRFWLHFFNEKRKRQFIPFPWKIGEIILRGIAKIDEYSTHLNQFNLKYAEKIRGFDPSHIFLDHMTSVGFNNAFTNTLMFEEEEEGNTHDVPMQSVDDIETMVSSTTQYKQRGKGSNEKGTQSPMDLQKSSPTQKQVFKQQHHNKKRFQRVIWVVGVIKTLHKEKLKIPISSK